MPSRAQSSNAAFGLTKTYPFTECITGAELTDEYCTDVKAQKPVSIFTDNQGWVPASRSATARTCTTGYRNGSVVVPSVGNSPYTTRVVDENGTPLTEFYGLQVMPA
jgi:immune inhibitor A